MNGINKVLLIGSLLPFQGIIAQTQNEKPMNVVFFLADDLRWNSLHCMGTDYLITPNIDQLAKDGVLFRNAYATTAISCVSRATLLTGQYMCQHHVRDFATAIPEDKFSDTYPGQLRKHGYWTGHVGKYGIGKIRPSDYDYSSSYEGIHWYPVDKKTKIKRFPNGYSQIMGDSIHTTQRNLNDAMDFLKTRPADKPFCLSVSFFATHAEDRHPEQYRYQPESAKYYQDVDIPVPFSAKDEYLKRLPDFIKSEKNEGRNRWHWRFDTPEKYQKMMKGYFRLLTEVDVVIGKVVDELKCQGVYENTLIVFMGDNGYFHSEHQLADKWYPYNESVRVPLVIYDPRINKNKRNIDCNDIVLNIDIAPTILSAMGVDVPKVMQGEDLSKLYLSKKNKKWRKDFYYEHPVIKDITFIPSSEALISDHYKYIYWPDYDVEEFFDLRKDPYEINNLINDNSYKKEINKAKARFEKLKNKANNL